MPTMSFENLITKRLSLKFVKHFGYAGFGYITKHESNLHATAVPGDHLGCDDGVYNVQRLNNSKVVRSVYVPWDEPSFPGLDLQSKGCREDDTSTYSGH